MKIPKRFKIFLYILIIIFVVNAYELSSLGSYFNFLFEKLWYNLFYRYYDYNEIDNNFDDINSKYVLYECIDFCGGWADRLKGKKYIFFYLKKCLL